jgi:hypothetical protein
MAQRSDLQKVCDYLNNYKKKKPSRLQKIQLGFLMHSDPAIARSMARFTLLDIDDRGLQKLKSDLMFNFDLHTFEPEQPQLPTVSTAASSGANRSLQQHGEDRERK